MGIASRDLTGDGYPEVYLTSQADNKLQTLADPAERPPTYDDIALERGATAHQPYAGGRRALNGLAPRIRRREQRRLRRPLRREGQRGGQAEYATRDPSNLLLGQPDGTFVEGAVHAGIMTFARPRPRLADLNLDGLLDLVVVTRRERGQVWRNVGARRGGGARPRWATWIAVRP